MEPRGRERHRWANRRSKWAGARESTWTANEFQIFANFDQKGRHGWKICALALHEPQIKRDGKVCGSIAIDRVKFFHPASTF
jgi:hypothetical protein